ncbi:hypothetical protein IFR05_004158 [Cadophora sp. M221]|nr:hypothetical protein IFR05_004158 [Cadophora sp. M221]
MVYQSVLPQIFAQIQIDRVITADALRQRVEDEHDRVGQEQPDLNDDMHQYVVEKSVWRGLYLDKYGNTKSRFLVRNPPICTTNVQEPQPMSLEAEPLVAEVPTITTIIDTPAAAIVHTPVLSSKVELAYVQPQPRDELPQASSKCTAILVKVEPPANVLLGPAALRTKSQVAKLIAKEFNQFSTRIDHNGAATLRIPVGKSRNTNTGAHGVDVQDEADEAGVLSTGLSDPEAAQTLNKV